ncbi:MAG TPA: MFS transporter [Acidimicrobiales bacterium]
MPRAADGIPSPALAPHRQWLALAVLVLPVLLISMDNTILGLAVPSLSADLEPTSSQLLWIVDVYSFVVAGLLVTMGTLGDRIGRLRLLLIGTSAFGVASVVAAFATSAPGLIGARAVLGVAGATLLPATLALIRNVFPDARRRQLAVAVWATTFSVGSAVGPLIGGLLLEHYWWGSVFLVAAPVPLLVVPLGMALVPESRDEAPGRFDVASSALSIATMLPAVYGVKKLAEHGWGGDVALGLAGGVVAGVAFVRRQRRLESPMIDVELFRVRAFRTAITGQVVACMGLAGGLYFATQYLQLVLGLSPVRVAVHMLPAVTAGMVTSLAAPGLARRLGAFAVIAAGMVTAAGGFAVMSQVPAAGEPFAAVTGLLLVNAGVSVAMTVSIDGILGAIPPAKAGAGASMSETANEAGIALGTAVLGSIAAYVYRRAFAGAGLDPSVLVEARETLGAAEQVADRLGGTAGEALRGLAHQGFVDGVEAGALAGVAILAVAAWRAAATARRPAPPRRPARTGQASAGPTPRASRGPAKGSGSSARRRPPGDAGRRGSPSCR